MHKNRRFSSLVLDAAFNVATLPAALVSSNGPSNVTDGAWELLAAFASITVMLPLWVPLGFIGCVAALFERK